MLCLRIWGAKACLYFTCKHPIPVVWKGREGLDCACVYVSGGYVYTGAGKHIALSASIRFAMHINCVSVCVFVYLAHWNTT